MERRDLLNTGAEVVPAQVPHGRELVPETKWEKYRCPCGRVALVLSGTGALTATPMSLSLDERNPRMWRYAPRTGAPPLLYPAASMLA